LSKIHKNGVLALTLMVAFFALSLVLFRLTWTSSLEGYSNCPDKYSLSSEDFRCRKPVIANYAFMGAAAAAIGCLLVGISQRQTPAQKKEIG
jgi:hypothetical protein